MKNSLSCFSLVLFPILCLCCFLNPLSAQTKKGPMSAVYVEVNTNNFQNVMCYTLQQAGQQLFDIGIIFAANINYNTSTKRAQLFFNSNVKTVLAGKASYIQPLQARGIKVLLSILGNHQGAGISNFTSRSAARTFAVQVAAAVAYSGLDGVDFDDEYADYGTNGTPQPNDSSFVILLSELRQALPAGKIISFYYIGPSINSLSYGGMVAGSFLNYSWNPYYGTFGAPRVPGLNNSQLAAAAVDIQTTPQALASSLATQTVSQGYGWYLWYALPDVPEQSYFSPVSLILNGAASNLTSGCLQQWNPQAGERRRMRVALPKKD